MKKQVQAELNTGTLFLELLFLLFLGLKLGNVIDWSWWWVFSPLWLPAGLVVLLIGLAFLGAALVAQIKLRRATGDDKKNKK